MEQYTRDCDPREIQGKTPAILVHCKAGKGRTGMMICSLLLFINMFPSAEKSIEHYDCTRVKDDKGLTISSQRRYVKFFEGFLNTELILRSDNQNQMHKTNQNKFIREQQGWFELYVKRYNKLMENMVFNDMVKHQLKIESIALGPFTQKRDKLTLKLF